MRPAGVASTTPKDPKKFSKGVIELVNDPFFKGNDRVIGDLDIFRTDSSTTFGDVAITDPVYLGQFLDTRFNVKRMHLESCDVYEESWADEFLMQMMFTQHVAYVLA